MNKEEKQKILDGSKTWFKEIIAKNHLRNTTKLTDPDEFNINPFLLPYLANFLSGNNDPKSLAKALIYPRVLGSSITTSFGTNIQSWVGTVFDALGSSIKGFDIEFTDAITGRLTFCQLKAGPNTINADDVEPMKAHFLKAFRTGSQNRRNVIPQDYVIGVLFGEESELNGHYKVMRDDYPVYVGQDFWHRLTNDENFYFELAEAFAETAMECNAEELLEEVIDKLSKSDKIVELAKSLNKK